DGQCGQYPTKNEGDESNDDGGFGPEAIGKQAGQWSRQQCSHILCTDHDTSPDSAEFEFVEDKAGQYRQRQPAGHIGHEVGADDENDRQRGLRGGCGSGIQYYLLLNRKTPCTLMDVRG